MILVLAGSDIAAAHTEATVSEGAQAGAGPGPGCPSTLQLSRKPRVSPVPKTRLPEGPAPGSVALASGPDGWTLASTAHGLEVTGPALPPEVDAQFAITMARLPADRTELLFKPLRRYPD